MNRVIIICEGQTEKNFCKKILVHHFSPKGVIVQLPLIKESGGGIVKWDILKKQVLSHLKGEPSAYVSTFFDYYGLKDIHEFPRWTDSKKQLDKKTKVDILEKAMKEQIDELYRCRFIPYIQLHEFEALLFINKCLFYNNFEIEEVDELESIFKEHGDDPEMINNNKNTAPSKRIERMALS